MPVVEFGTALKRNTETRERFKIWSLSELESLPPAEPLIADVLDAGEPQILAGSYATAKSFVAVSMAVAVASGTPWFDKPVRQGNVLYVATEGKRGMVKRIRAAENAVGVSVDDTLTLMTDTPAMAASSDVDAVAEKIRKTGPYALVIWDTLSRVAQGIDENSAAMTGIIQAIEIASADAAALIIHHANKDGGIRGSTSVVAGVENAYVMAKDGLGDSARYTMTGHKHKERSEGEVWTFTLTNVDGTAIPTLLEFKPANDDVSDGDPTEALREQRAKTGLAVLAQRFKETFDGPVKYATVWQAVKAWENVSVRTAKTRVAAMVDAGTLVKNAEGLYDLAERCISN